MLDALGVAIKDTDGEPIAGRSNNDTDNEVDIGTLGPLGATIKDMDV